MAGKEKQPSGGTITEERVKELIAVASQGQLTLDQVKALFAVAAEKVTAQIAEAIKELVTKDELTVFATRDELVDAVRELTPQTLEAFGGLPAATGFEEKERPLLDTDWLEGLTFRGAKPEKKAAEGQSRPALVPFERPLRAGDVLNWSVGDGTVTLVATDGRKHKVNI